MTELKVYTEPMNSRCIRVKEFLNFTGAEFEEVNIEEEDTGELEEIVESVKAPIVRFEDSYVEGFNREAIIDLVEQAGFEPDLEGDAF